MTDFLNDTFLGFPVGSAVKNLPGTQETQETWVQSPGQEDSPGERNSNHSSILAWRIPWTEETGGLQLIGHKELDTTEHAHIHCLFASESLVIFLGSKTCIFFPR